MKIQTYLAPAWFLIMLASNANNTLLADEHSFENASQDELSRGPIHDSLYMESSNFIKHINLELGDSETALIGFADLLLILDHELIEHSTKLRSEVYSTIKKAYQITRKSSGQHHRAHVAEILEKAIDLWPDGNQKEYFISWGDKLSDSQEANPQEDKNLSEMEKELQAQRAQEKARAKIRAQDEAKAKAKAKKHGADPIKDLPKISKVKRKKTITKAEKIAKPKKAASTEDKPKKPRKRKTTTSTAKPRVPKPKKPAAPRKRRKPKAKPKEEAAPARPTGAKKPKREDSQRPKEPGTISQRLSGARTIDQKDLASTD